MNNNVLLGLAFGLGALGASSSRKLAGKWGLIDQVNERSSHAQPTPRGGGLGIVIALLCMSMFLGFSIYFAIAFCGMAVLGFLSDKWNIKPQFRILLQFLCGAIFWFGIFDSGLWSGWIFGLFFMILMVGTANYYNFMDGINGIAGITGVVGFLLLALFIGDAEGDTNLFVFSLSIAFACAGFLPFNMPRAKVFMGDVGSLTLGFVFAGCVILLARDMKDFMILCSFLYPFYFDELFTMVVRIRQKENLFQAHRKHLYQILANELDISQWRISVGYGIVQAFIGLTTMALGSYNMIVLICFLVGVTSIFGMAGLGIRHAAWRRKGFVKN